MLDAEPRIYRYAEFHGRRTRYLPHRDRNGNFILAFDTGDHSQTKKPENQRTVGTEGEAVKLLASGEYRIWMLPEGGARSDHTLIKSL